MSEIERLRAWKREATLLFDGMQDLGRALGLPLGTLVTGPLAVEAANELRDRLEAAEAKVARVEAVCDEAEKSADTYKRACIVTTGKIRDALADTRPIPPGTSAEASGRES